MVELTAAQSAILERVIGCGFRLVAFPLYASAIGVCRGAFAALLVPAPEGGLRVLGEPCYLIEGNLSVLIRRGAVQYFVWKDRSVEATAERLAERRKFSADLAAALSPQL